MLEVDDLVIRAKKGHIGADFLIPKKVYKVKLILDNDLVVLEHYLMLVPLEYLKKIEKHE